MRSLRSVLKSAAEPAISVITLTRKRPDLLGRAIASVQNQKCNSIIEHIILVDDCEDTRTELRRGGNIPANVKWHWVDRNQGEHSGPSRCAKLRNFGVSLAKNKWIAFLDDDNEWKDNHLDALLRCAVDNRLRAVHSHRILLYRDGTPFAEARFPWCRDPEEARRLYRQLCERGVFTPGSPVVKDRADLKGHPKPVRMIDMGEWLIDRELLEAIPLRLHFTDQDGDSVFGEDDKFLADLIDRNEPIGCTNIPTLLYYLGGFSNNFDPSGDESFNWRS